MPGVVYTISNRATRKLYVGKTTRGLKTRWREHLAAAARGTETYLCRAIRKHGAESFDLRIVAKTSDDACLNALERMYIRLYRSHVTDGGYNLTEGGDGCRHWLGKKFSPEHCRRMSEVRFRQNIPSKDIAQLYEQGLTCAAIADRFNTNRTTISWRLRRLGVRMRPVGRHRKTSSLPTFQLGELPRE